MFNIRLHDHVSTMIISQLSDLALPLIALWFHNYVLFFFPPEVIVNVLPVCFLRFILEFLRMLSMSLVRPHTLDGVFEGGNGRGVIRGKN